ncbi:Trans-aconitate 2-methyltransferase, partial [Fusarium oxysporum f. sp. albedinis]
FCDWPYKIWTNQIPRNLFIPVCTKPSLFGKT